MKPNAPRKNSSILRRITLMAWLVAVMSVCVFAAILVLYQKRSIQKELESEAERMANDLNQEISENVGRHRFSAVVDQCLRTLEKEKGLVYLVVSLADSTGVLREGNSLAITTPGSWQEVSLTGPEWVPPREDLNRGRILVTPVFPREACMHYSAIGAVDGNWGWIHLGLSLERYDQAIMAIYRNVGIAGAVVLLIGAAAAYTMAKNIITPLRALQSFAQRVATGALNARASVKAEGEIGDLADSFNRMVESLEQSQSKIRESMKSQASLREKEILLREIHHRVKNNMQILTSLLRLQTRQADSDELREVLQESEARIRSMGLLHEKLYQSESVSVIDMNGYLKTLTAELVRVNTPMGSSREIKLNVKGVNLGLDTALPCGLIITELVTNALKYAFPGQKEGAIYVSLATRAAHEYALTVWDNGVGMSSQFDLSKATSLGMRLVKMLTDQLHGTLSFDGNQGTRIEITFKESHYTHRL